ncbi:flagellar assembly protein FliW [Viridibacillus sp. FSL R5-0477]|uniref:Flagellar assembly factor FliW n=1 Tax=Viridibacillus arenosi FSL R5-213 TaxID=1227360 RepID=W4F6F3_9BACL|nr:flagellar assembly protein FliW [Viridibacillus arenosi]ETT87874.1 flagellar assembly factor fliW [Viridibacillus arenosi FSL R5-213]OMC89885.1 flagellar assembly protein FliW [Viridibacillus arenosi]
MNIKTKFLGSVEIKEEDIIKFEEGIPGFEGAKKFIILPLEKESPFAILQSIEQVEVGFVVAFPFLFKKNYAFDLPKSDKVSLKAEVESDIVTYSIVTLKDPFDSSTLNLLAPVLINIKEKIGKQIVLQENGEYALRHPIGTLEGSAK